mgnify:CR=1 FL=1
MVLLIGVCNGLSSQAQVVQSQGPKEIELWHF